MPLSRRVDLASLMVLLFLALALPDGRADAAPAGQASGKLQLYQGRQQDLHKGFALKLEELARWCDERNRPEAAAEVRRWSAARKPQSVQFEKLPEQVQPDIPVSLPEDERHWQMQLRHARQEYAKDLYLLSRQALHAGFPSYAYHLVRETAHYDPDHSVARSLLGYLRQGDRWMTPFAAEMARRHRVWHDKFGWLLRTHVERYANGERYYNGRWISAAQEEEIRRDFRHAWEIRTEHYLVKTNHSLERGVEVARTLEEFHDFFQQIFAAFFNTPEQMEKLFLSAAASRRTSPSRQYEVHYYRTRDEYNERLVGKIPQIAQTNGLYYPADRTAYFYHDDEADGADATLYHEASHQLFYESANIDRAIAEHAHFWAVEGIACYLESFVPEEDRFSLGDPRFVRFYWARHRLLKEKYHVPLAEFAALGMREFQNAPNFQELQRRYSQASGLAHFFMHYDDGRYRDPFIAHLAGLYSGNPRRLLSVPSLPELTGVSAAELDQQYQEYIADLERSIEQDRTAQHTAGQ